MLIDLKLSKELGFEDLGLHNEIAMIKVNEDGYDRGIWARGLIFTDWQQIIDLCTKGLEKSKDLTLALRLTEALTNKYGLEGLKHGIEIMSKVSEGDFYPLPGDFRERIFQWIDEKLPIIAFYNNTIDYSKLDSLALSNVKNILSAIKDKLNKLPFVVHNFKEILDNMLIKIHNESKKTHTITESDIISADLTIENNTKLHALINQLSELMPQQKDEILKILMSKKI
jgi:hypothetical protein